MVSTRPSVSARCSGAQSDATSRLCASSPPIPGRTRKDGLLLLARAARRFLEALLAGGDPRHHGPELGADLLDLVLAGLAAVLVGVGTAVLVLGGPLLGGAALLLLVRGAAHLRPGRLGVGREA